MDSDEERLPDLAAARGSPRTSRRRFLKLVLAAGGIVVGAAFLGSALTGRFSLPQTGPRGSCSDSLVPFDANIVRGGPPRTASPASTVRGS
ncbi:MAG: twin-arginine translocation signal domain-containing protein [Candidatus Rokubacteria bacterium]|nr:twin-arginine translocation signal domain-containing protein [Candidatus Rokubacteria bacterium]